MRREGSMAVHTLFHLHRTVRSDFSSVPLYFIKYKSSFYLAVTLLETAVKVTHAGAADKTSLQALRPSQHPRGACCSQILSPSCNHQTSQVLAEVSKHCINKQREKKKASGWLRLCGWQDTVSVLLYFVCACFNNAYQSNALSGLHDCCDAWAAVQQGKGGVLLGLALSCAVDGAVYVCFIVQYSCLCF